MSEQFLNMYLKLQATVQLFHHGSVDHWQWPMIRVTHPKMVTHWPISISGSDILGKGSNPPPSRQNSHAFPVIVYCLSSLRLIWLGAWKSFVPSFVYGFSNLCNHSHSGGSSPCNVGSPVDSSRVHRGGSRNFPKRPSGGWGWETEVPQWGSVKKSR